MFHLRICEYKFNLVSACECPFFRINTEKLLRD